LFPALPASEADLNPHTRLRDSVSLFQQHLIRAGKSDHTVHAFTSDLQLLAEHSDDETSLGDFTTTRLNAFLEWLEHGRGVPCSRKSYARRVTTLKVFFKWLAEIGAIPHDPAKPVLQRSGPAPLALILTPDEVDDALAHGDRLRRAEKPDARPALLFRLLLETGIKKNETMRLTPDHLDRTNPLQSILIVRHKSAKDVYKERLIPMSPDWAALLDEYLAQYHPRAEIFNCTARNLEYVLEDLGDGAGIEPKISFEMMRWTCAVRDYLAAIDPEAIREKMGLSKISWHETFAKIKRLAEAQVKHAE
jgi:integrase/recombinase XerD